MNLFASQNEVPTKQATTLTQHITSSWNKAGFWEAALLALFLICRTLSGAEELSSGMIDAGQPLDEGLSAFEVTADAPLWRDLGIVVDPGAEGTVVETGCWYFEESNPIFSKYGELTACDFYLFLYSGDFLEVPGPEALVVFSEPEITVPSIGMSVLLNRNEESQAWSAVACISQVVHPLVLEREHALFVATEVMRGSGVYYEEEVLYEVITSTGELIEILRYPLGDGYWDGWPPINARFSGESFIERKKNTIRLSIHTRITYSDLKDDSEFFTRKDVSIWEWNKSAGYFRHVSGMNKLEVGDLGLCDIADILRDNKPQFITLARRGSDSQKQALRELVLQFEQRGWSTPITEELAQLLD